MPFFDEHLTVAPERTAAALTAAKAHAAKQLLPSERVLGLAEGHYVPRRASVLSRLRNRGWSRRPGRNEVIAAAQRRHDEAGSAELIITDIRLLVLAQLHRDILKPARLLDQGGLGPAGRIFLPTTAAECEEPGVSLKPIVVDNGVFYAELGFWFHQ